MRANTTTNLLPILIAVGTMLCLSIPSAFANMKYLVSIRTRLDRLHGQNELTLDQYNYITSNITDNNDELLDAVMTNRNDSTIITTMMTIPLLDSNHAKQFSGWLDQEEADDTMTTGTANLIRNIFDLRSADAAASSSSSSRPETTNGPAPARYDTTTTGVVQFIARSKSFPDETFYNGIWGFTKGIREYALQCSNIGLHILDVTTTTIIVVQTIIMEGGDIYRDVATHDSYAYIGAQAGENPDAYVVNLTQLSGTAVAHGTNSNPITTNNIKNIGEEGWGHTTNVWNGLLFLNGAGTKANSGCRIFDLLEDPMTPRYITTYIGGDCHDSYGQTIGDRDILFSADGVYGKYRLLDITNIRSTSSSSPQSSIPQIGETEYMNVYAHQNVVSDDGTTLFVTDESNEVDIAVFDISILSNPRLISTFQWSGEQTERDAIVHNGAILGDYLLVAYYNAGLRVFDISNVTSIEEVGNYETYRNPDGKAGIFDKDINDLVTGGIQNFDGAWNVATLQSGKILISDTISGTFVVQINKNTSGTIRNTPTPSSPPTIIKPWICVNKQKLEIKVRTDNIGEETRINLRKRNKSMRWGWTIIDTKGFENKKIHKFYKCVDVEKECYRFKITHKRNNEFQNGFIKLSLDGKTMYRNTFRNKLGLRKKRLYRFGQCMENQN